VKRIIMGLDKHKRTPCGFCFVEYLFYQLVSKIWVNRAVEVGGVKSMWFEFVSTR